MAGLAQQSSESVEAYGLRAMDILNKYVSTITEAKEPQYVQPLMETGNNTIVECFIRGLNTEIESRFMNRNLPDLQAAIIAATKIEYDLKLRQQLFPDRGNARSIKRIGAAPNEEDLDPAKRSKPDNTEQQPSQPKPQNEGRKKRGRGRGHNNQSREGQNGQKGQSAQNGQQNQEDHNEGNSPSNPSDEHIKVVYVALQNQRNQGNFYQQRGQAPQMRNGGQNQQAVRQGGPSQPQIPHNLAFNGNCYRCGEYGHSARSCTNASPPQARGANQNSPPPRNFNNQNPRGPSNKWCPFCKSQTHNESECRTLPNARDYFREKLKDPEFVKALNENEST